MNTDSVTRARFVSLRKRLFNAIDAALRQDCAECKQMNNSKSAYCPECGVRMIRDE